MCRLLAYVGPPVLIADVVLWPDRSIIKQSYDARERIMDESLPSHLAHGNLNGDGFGIGWHNASSEPPDKTPCVFTSVTPAWNNDNLGRLASKITSPVVFAHVRAAMPGMPVSEQNCHPFQWGRYLWMHNGVVGGFMRIRRQLTAELSDEAFNTIQSFHSDSAVCFGIFLNYLPDLQAEHPPQVLLRALENTIAHVSKTQKEAGITDTSLLNFVVSDGFTLLASRYVYPEKETAASLYYSEGSAFKRSVPIQNSMANGNGIGNGIASARPDSTDGATTARHSSVSGEGSYSVQSSFAGASKVVLVASEPVTDSKGDWVSVPKNKVLVVNKGREGLIDITRTSMHASGVHDRQEEISLCLEALSSASEVTARKWSQKRDQANGNSSDTQKVPDFKRASSYADPFGVPAPVTNLEEHTLSGHRGPVLCFARLGEKLLFSGSTDCNIKVWDLTTFSCVKTLYGHNKPVQHLTQQGDKLYSIAGRKLRVWDLKTFKCIRNIHTEDEGGGLRALAVGLDGTVYAAGQDTRLRAFSSQVCDAVHCPKRSDCPEEHCIPRITTSEKQGHCSGILALATCEGYVCSAGGDAMIRIWQEHTLEFVMVLRGHRGAILTLFSLGGLLLSGGRDNIIRVWDMDALVCRRTLTGHTHDVLSITGLDFCPQLRAQNGHYQNGHNQNGDQLHSSDSFQFESPTSLFASASSDETLRIWDAKDWTCLRIIIIGDNPIKKVHPGFLSAFLTSRYLLAGKMDGSLGLWSVRSLVGGSDRAPFIRNNSEDSNASIQEMQTRSLRSKVSINESIERQLEESLRHFVSLKTVSSDRALKEQCYRGAKYLSRLLVEVLGAEVKVTRAREDKNPVVLGRLGRNENNPTVTFYGHYDVQPAMEKEWNTDPFTVHSKNGYFYGRGTSDNKGPILAFIYAVKEMLEEGKGCKGSLPVNVAFIFEGEEENGSVGFEESVKDNLHWLEGTQLIVISNTLWVGERVPCLTYGMRGMIALSVEVKGPSRDLHSGTEGGVFHEPTLDLVKVLGKLLDENNRIQIPGWYTPVRHNTLAAALERLDALEPPEFTLQEYKETLGIPELNDTDTHTLLQARWCAPTLSIVDVRVGDDEESSHDPHYRFGPTRFSVIPRLAVGNVSVRFVPDQRPEELVDLLTSLVQKEFKKLNTGNVLSVRVKSVGDWWEADPKSKFFCLAESALQKEWGVRPLFVREGGTMPVASTLEKLLNAPALLVPFGQASDNCHLSNERLSRDNLFRGKNVIKNLLHEIEEQHHSPRNTAEASKS